jgi:pyruvate,water dikinase
MTDLLHFDQITPGDGEAVGGKGLSLGLLAQAGLPVPDGFCVTSAVHRRLRGQSPRDHPDLVGQIGEAYRRLGAGLVAVRSSATDEDGAITSFAGQQETILGVQGEEAIVEAIGRCWASLDSERATAYRQRQGLGADGLATAVVVQRLVPAEAAGVLFTRDPLDPQGQRMLVEASWGLGESVVSGRVMPDRFHLDRVTGQVQERHVASKAEQMTAAGVQPVPPELRDQPCLNETQLAELADLGRRVEAYYGEPRDVEWAWQAGRFWLLQARPITTTSAAEREQVRQEEIAALASKAEAGGTVWSRFNLSEVLPEPTPMTWAIVRCFMSGRGGFGLMYRDLGFHPDHSLDEEGVYDLVAGRPYCNLSREPRLYSGWLPYEHPFAVLKAEPHRALYPQPIRNPARVGPAFWLFLPLRLPFLMIGSVRLALRLGNLSRTFATRFREKIVPDFVAEVNRTAESNLDQLDDAALRDQLDYWARRVLVDFARDSLKPTALAAIAMANLERWLGRKLGPEGVRTALGELTMGVKPDPEADLPGALRDLIDGRLDRAAFLTRFGHRGNQEMELAQPRWSEDASALESFHQPSGKAPETPMGPAAVWTRIAEEAKLSALERTALEPQVQALQTYLGLRETAKHHLMRGYALLRRILVELDRRHHLHGGVFFLTPEELSGLGQRKELLALIAQRRRRRAVALSLEAPPVLFSDDLHALGRPMVIEGGDCLQGVPLSAGVAEAEALVLDQPMRELPTQPYILVCPSTDPAWVPLFVRARGLVMETGGVLSHGAIVAREFGLPAVAGLPGVVKRLRSGQRLRVDGSRGVVTVLPA